MDEDCEESDATCAIKVYCRIRPLVQNETAVVFGHSEAGTLVITPPNSAAKCYKFDHVFDCQATQADVFSRAAEDVICRVLQGFNGALLAYGATFSGKTYTISGPHYFSQERGLIPRTIDYLFEFFEKHSHANSPELSVEDYSISISFIEIYMEKLRDLLAPLYNTQAEGQRELQVYSFPVYTRPNAASPPVERVHVKISGLTKVTISSRQEAQKVLEEANANKVIGSNKINQQSSRSHSILIVNLCYNFKTKEDPKLLHQRTSQLHIVDLAGSESILRTQAEGERLNEARYINTSLLALGKVINQLSTNNNHSPTEYTTLLSRNSYSRPLTYRHISYRDSLLTRILQNCLSGDSVTAILVHFNPDLYSLHESLSTLKFATRAAHIRTSPVQAESLFDDDAIEDTGVSPGNAQSMTEQDLDICQLKTLGANESDLQLLCISELRSLVRILYNGSSGNGGAPPSSRNLAVLACALDDDIDDGLLCHKIAKCISVQDDSRCASVSENSILDTRRAISFVAADPQAEEIQRLLSIHVKEYVSVDVFNQTVREMNMCLSQLYTAIEYGDASEFLMTLGTMQQRLKGAYKWVCMVSILRIRRDGDTLLSYAIANDFLSIIEPLLKASPPLATEKDRDGTFALHKLLQVAPRTFDARLFVDTLALLMEYSPENIVMVEQTPDNRGVMQLFADICPHITDEFGTSILHTLIAEEIPLLYPSFSGSQCSVVEANQHHIITILIELNMQESIKCTINAMKSGLTVFSLSPFSDHTLKRYMEALEQQGFGILLDACFAHDQDKTMQHAFDALTPNYKLALVVISARQLAAALSEGRYACAMVVMQTLYNQNATSTTKTEEQPPDESPYALALRVFFSQSVLSNGCNLFEYSKDMLDKSVMHLTPSTHARRGCIALMELLLEDFPGKRRFFTIEQVYDVLLELQQCAIPSVEAYEQILCGWDRLPPTLVRQAKLNNYDFCELCIRMLNPLAFEVLASKLLAISSAMEALQRFLFIFPETMEKCSQLVGNSEDWAPLFIKLRLEVNKKA